VRTGWNEEIVFETREKENERQREDDITKKRSF
jgi:hypothetical protein